MLLQLLPRQLAFHVQLQLLLMLHLAELVRRRRRLAAENTAISVCRRSALVETVAIGLTMMLDEVSSCSAIGGHQSISGIVVL